jgi:hypothetical protein
MQVFSELPESDQEEVIRLYYESDLPVHEIISQFHLSHKPGRLTNEFPPLITDEQCPYCDVELVLRRPTRTGSNYRDYHPYCNTCGHGKRHPCRCENCRKRSEQIANSLAADRLEGIQSSFPYQEIGPGYFPHSMREAVALIAADRHSLDQYYTSFHPEIESPLPFGATWFMSKEMLMLLFRSGVMQVDHDSDPDAFIFDDKLDIPEFYPMKCKWLYLPVNSIDFRRELLRSISRVLETGKWPDAWECEIDHIWREIVKAECLAHMTILHSERNLQFEINEPKTIDTIMRGLRAFSPAQLNNLCWQSVRDTVDYMAKENIPSRSAQNVSRAILSRKIDRALVDGWQVKPSHRDRRLPRSAASHVFFDLVTGFGDSYFREVAPGTEE